MSPVEAEYFSYIDNVFNMYMQLVIKLGPGSPMNLPFFFVHCSFVIVHLMTISIINRFFIA